MAAQRRDSPTGARQRGQAELVTAVVCAAFDATTDAAVHAVREVVRAAGVPLPSRPPHRPHFSLAAARVTRGEELDRVVAAAADVAARFAPHDVMFDEVGRFGRAGALWLGPTVLPAPTARLQRTVDERLVAAGWPRAFGEHSEPDQWVAHCTLATRVAKPELRGVQSAVRDGYRPITGRLDALAVILVGGRGDIAHLPFPS